ncbi:RING-H2 finger protein ATL64 [Cardamine amara subsp. amara]|uniref:RING-type E3 ubiquitin transferase n=1 Tax=Cardamine amara subsp. amara TaxID=228776 RepID=A0ABD1AKG4_CARAN
MDTSCCGDYAATSPVAQESESLALRLMIIVFFFGLILLLCFFIYPKLPKGSAGDEESGEPLPPAIYLVKKSGGITTEACVICLEEFEKNDAVRILVRCRHVYHVQCIDSWCLYKLACPVCRAPFRLFGDW